MVPPQLAASATHSFSNTSYAALNEACLPGDTADIRFPLSEEIPATSTRKAILSTGNSRGHSTFALASARTLPDSLSLA